MVPNLSNSPLNLVDLLSRGKRLYNLKDLSRRHEFFTGEDRDSGHTIKDIAQ